MTCDIFIRSWSNDFRWLTYCLRSIQRFATVFRQVVIVVPQGHVPPTGTMEKVFFVHESMDGYMQQQHDKLHADYFTDAEFILFIDSDTIFTRPVRPEDFIRQNRYPIWLYTPYASINSGDGQTWKKPTEKVLGYPVEFEFMRRHPFCIPRWAFNEFRGFIMRTHQVSLERYIMAQVNKEFSEFNAIGAYLFHYHNHRIIWQNTDEEMGTCYVHQHYSWGGLSPEIERNLEAALV